MKLYFLVTCFLFSILPIQTACAQDQTGAGERDKMKAALLRSSGWKVDHIGARGSGQAEFIYEAHGEKVVVKIRDLSRSGGSILLNCERDVTITSDTIKHDGCRDFDITLLFDPKDQEFPFKGKSPRGTVYNLKAK